MTERIKFFRKNWLDLEHESASIIAEDPTASDLGLTDKLRNRSNFDGWSTLESTGPTTLTCTFEGMVDITDVFLLAGNIAPYTIEFKDNLDNPVVPVETENKTAQVRSLFSHWHSFEKFTANKMIITMTGASDKKLAQLIATTRIGELEAWPEINKPLHKGQVKTTKMVSGKSLILNKIPSFSFDLRVKLHSIVNDMGVIEQLHNATEGFLISLSGGDQDQFFYPLSGYRLMDLYLVKMARDYSPQLYKGIYSAGAATRLSFSEVAT